MNLILCIRRGLVGLCCWICLGVSAQTKLSGTVFGQPGNGLYGQANVFDGDTTTFFDVGGTPPPGDQLAWAALDLGVGQTITKIRFHPRLPAAGDTNPWPAQKMLGGEFQGANNANFSDSVTLYRITSLPAIHAYTTVNITSTASYRYVRYLAPNISAATTGVTTSNGNVSEVEFYANTVNVAAKGLYIPLDWRNTSLAIPWDSTVRCKQSANFAVFWGPLAGNDPTVATNTALRFNPQTILDSLEDVYSDYITKWNLLPDSGTLARYKIIVVMNNTWNSTLYTGYLYGGGFDNVIGAMFIDPAAVGSTDTWGLSHEFTHACQYMITYCLYPGHGFGDAHSGFFWETHAQYMAWQRLPGGLANADQARELNFTNYTMSSGRKHYANFYYLELLKQKYGINFIGRIWREANYSTSHEHPFQTIQRLLGLNQAGMNQLFMEHAMRNVKWDYQRQTYIQSAMTALGTYQNWHADDLLDSLGAGYYSIPDNLAPQQYGYNVVRLYVSDSSCSTPYVHVKFKGHVSTAASSGWLYGFVGVNSSGVSTYSSQYSDSEVVYQFPAGQTEYYMVVMGAPTTFHVHTNLFEIGFPKEFRYPWEVHMEGMVPKGYQKDFHGIAGVAGSIHANGGGFVASTASVASTVFVGPQAAVLNTAVLTGSVQVLNKAVVRDNAHVSGSAVISGFADVAVSATVSGTVKISGQAKVFNTSVISDSSTMSDNAVVADAHVSGGSKAYGNLFDYAGTIGGGAQFGGDAENFSSCTTKGIYLQSEGAQESTSSTSRGFCDGSSTNILNVDTNAAYSHFGVTSMAFGKTQHCGVFTSEVAAPIQALAGLDSAVLSGMIRLYPVPARDAVTLVYPVGHGGELTIYDTRGVRVMSQRIAAGSSALQFPVGALSPGVYFVRVDIGSGGRHTLKLVIAR